MFKYWSDLAEQQLNGGELSREAAQAILSAPDHEVMEIVAAGSRLRRAHFQDTVKVNYLVNLKSGLCPEDCHYCSQRLGSEATVLKYRWLPQDDALAQARAGIAGGARRICMVASGRGPSAHDVERVATIVDELKSECPEVEVCACLGTPARRAGRDAEGRWRRRVQPQPEHQRIPLRRDLLDAHLPGSRRHH